MKHSLDAAVVHDRRLFAYGWAYDSSHPMRDLFLKISYADGSEARLPVSSGRERTDVAAAFPSEPQARWSGWMAYVGWNRPARRIELTGTLEGGETFVFPLPCRVGPAPLAQRLAQLASAAIESTARNTAAPGSPLLVSTLRAAMEASGLRRLCVVLDHSMGGGANKFRAEWVRGRLAQLPMLAVLGFDVHTMSWRLELHLATGHVIGLPGCTDLPSVLLGTGLVGEVFANDAVSYPHPARVPQWLKTWADEGAEVTVAFHDYLAICPSPFLLNDAGRFCGVPHLEECLRCMKSNPNTFPVVQPGPDMGAWRQTWGEALALARQLLCFSESSRELLLRAYPHLDIGRISVVPHTVHPFPRTVTVPIDGPLHVGVVGAIGAHKGADVLRDLAIEAEKQRAGLRITVFGTLEGVVDQRVISVTGPYEREELPALIESSGANIFLLPSVCPETFSYVTHELIGLGVPLACFALGAPADRVARYGLGRVLQLAGPVQLLHDLARFHRDMQRTSLREST